jgi:hypothetical protein
MAKYTIRPIGEIELFEEAGMNQMYRDDDRGKPRPVGEYKNALLPHGVKTHRVFYNSKKRIYEINIPSKVLNEIALKLRFTDPLTKQVITKADVNNEFDPFMIQEELVLEVPNSGLTLDDEDPWGLFWLYAIKSAPKKFNLDNNTDNEAVKRAQEFKVTTAGKTEVEIDESVKEGMRATEIYHSIKDDFRQMMICCRALDIVVADNPPIDMLQKAIYLKITTEKDYRTKDGMRNIERFLSIQDMKTDDRETRAKVTEAIGLGIIEKENRKLMFEERNLGSSPEKAFEFLMRKENADMKARLLALVSQQSSQLV